MFLFIFVIEISIYTQSIQMYGLRVYSKRRRLKHKNIPGEFNLFYTSPLLIILNSYTLVRIYLKLEISHLKTRIYEYIDRELN